VLKKLIPTDSLKEIPVAFIRQIRNFITILKTCHD
jgi:hypothetical protein